MSAFYIAWPSIACTDCEWTKRVTSIVQVCGMHERIGTLAHNLAVGAALCRAFELGYQMPFASGKRWCPGCGWAVS